MLPEQKSLLSGLMSRFRNRRRIGRAAKGRTVTAGWRTSLEHLEERRLLVSRVFLDFGDDFAVPTTGLYAGFSVIQGQTPAALHNAFVGTGKAGNALYEEGVGILSGVGAPAFNLLGLGTLMNSTLNPTPVNSDPITMEEAITAQIQRALEPFDIQVLSSVNSNVLVWPQGPATNFNYASAIEATNNMPGDGGSPVTGSSTTPQFGSDDVYIVFAGLFVTVNNVAVATPVPISTDFAVQSAPSPGAKPDRMDTGGIIDVNYWINRVLGPGGTGGSLNIALANAAMYAIGWGYGLSEVDNGMGGPFSSFTDPNVTLMNQSNAMVEGGFQETTLLTPTISPNNPAYFPNFPMMQDGEYLAPLLQPGTLAKSALLGQPDFPLPPQDDFTFPLDGVNILEQSFSTLQQFTLPDGLYNADPTVTINSAQQLTNDPTGDIGANPDVAYVTGTGAFDKISIVKTDATHAQVTVTAYADPQFTTTVAEAAAADGNPGVQSTYSYQISLTKIVTPGRKDDGQPFRIVVDGTTSGDEIDLDPTLGVEVEVHGGGDVKEINLKGNGTYNVLYTPIQYGTVAPPNNTLQGNIANIASMIPTAGGLVLGGQGTMVITGTGVLTTTTIVNKKTVTKTTSSPFKTTILLDQMLDPTSIDPNGVLAEGAVLNGFNLVTYKAPATLDNDVEITVPTVGPLSNTGWQIAGSEQSKFYSNPFNAAELQIINVKQLAIDTTTGPSNDTVGFAIGDPVSGAGEIIPAGLLFVNVALGSQLPGGGQDQLLFDDSANLENQNYLISATQVLPVQPPGSTFTGFTYSGAEFVAVNGSAGTNDQFTVTPSTTTAYDITGNAANNTLAVHLAGTQYQEFDDGLGTGNWTFNNNSRKIISFSNIQTIVNQFGKDGVSPANYLTNPIADNVSPIYAGSEDSDILAIAASSDAGTSKPLVQVYSAITNQLLYQFYAFLPNYTGGVRVTTADVNGDGVPDIIVAPGAGMAAEVKVYDGAVLQFNATGPQKFVNNADTAVGPGPSFSPALLTDMVSVPDANANYKNGLYVAMGDVNGDGFPDLITSHSKGAPLVQVFLNDGSGVFNSTPDTTFAPYAKTVTTGVVIAAGDTDGDGTAEIVTAPGTGQIAQVKVFNYADVALNPLAAPVRQFNAFPTTFKGGVSLTMGDLDGDGLDEIIAGAGTGGKSQVAVFSGNSGALERVFQAYTTGNINAPVKVLARDVDSSGVAQLYTVPVLSSVSHTIQLLDPLSVINPLVVPLVAPAVDTIMESVADLKNGINLG